MPKVSNKRERKMTLALDEALTIAETAAGVGAFAVLSKDARESLSAAFHDRLMPASQNRRPRMHQPFYDTLMRTSSGMHEARWRDGPAHCCVFCGATVARTERCDHCGAYAADREILLRAQGRAARQPEPPKEFPSGILDTVVMDGIFAWDLA